MPYPARGYMPSDYFGPRHAWSLLLNTRHFSVGTGCGAKIYPLDETYKKGKPLELDYENYHPEMDVGTGQALIFRPKKIDVSPGHGYWVEIVGLKGADGRPTKIEYPVEFVEIKVAGAGKRAKGKVVEASGE